MAVNKKKFLLHIAYAQIIGIVFVVLGHSFHEYPVNNGNDLLLYRMMHNFRMPMFVFTSGFLMCFTAFVARSQAPTVAGFYLTKAKRLLIPLVAVSMILYVPRALMSGISDDPLPLDIQSWLTCVFYTHLLPNPLYWFLQMSLVVMLASYPLIRLVHTRRWPLATAYVPLFGLVVAARLVWSPETDFMALNMVPRYAGFFLLGCLFCEYKHRIDGMLKLERTSVFLTLVALWVLLFFVADVALPWLFDFASIVGIAMCYSLCRVLERIEWHGLDFLIGSNYMIFLLSWFANVAAQQVLAHFVDLPWPVHTILSFVGGVLGPWAVYRYMMDRSDRKWVRLFIILLGQRIKPVQPPQRLSLAPRSS